MNALAGRLINRARDFAFLPGTRRFWRKRLGGRAHVLVYHRVAPPGEHAFLANGGCPTIAPEEFEADIRFLKQIGARFMTFADLRNGWVPDAKEFGVLITFDDGFRDAYERGLNILADLSVKATLFQSTSMLSGNALINEHRVYFNASRSGGADEIVSLARRLLPSNIPIRALSEAVDALLQRVPVDRLEEAMSEDTGQEIAQAIYPNPSRIGEARRAGHEIGSHGHGHHHRATMGDTAFEQDLLRSKQVLEGLLGTPPTSYSYPFNARNAGDRERCAAHFSQIATVDAEPITPGYDPLAIPRFSWPGSARNPLRHRRWLLTGGI